MVSKCLSTYPVSALCSYYHIKIWLTHFEHDRNISYHSAVSQAVTSQGITDHFPVQIISESQEEFKYFKSTLFPIPNSRDKSQEVLVPFLNLQKEDLY